MALTLTKRLVPREYGRNNRIISGESTVSNRSASAFGARAAASSSSGNTGGSGDNTSTTSTTLPFIQYTFSDNTDVGVAPALHQFKDVGSELYVSNTMTGETHMGNFLSSLVIGANIVIVKSDLRSTYIELTLSADIIVESTYVRVPYTTLASSGVIGDGEGYTFYFLQSPSAGNDHNTLTNLQLAGTGVTWGHIDDQVQTIYGEKTFYSTIHAAALDSQFYVNESGFPTSFYIENDLALTLESTTATFSGTVNGDDAVALSDFVTLGQLNNKTHNSLSDVALVGTGDSYGHLSPDQWNSLMTYNFVDIIGSSGAVNIDFDSKNVFWMNEFQDIDDIQIGLLNDTNAKRMHLQVRTYTASTTIIFPPSFSPLDESDSRWSGNAFTVSGVGYYSIEATRSSDTDYWKVHVVPVDATGDHNLLTNLQLAGSGVTYGHVDDQAQTFAGDKTFANNVTIPQSTASTHAVRRDEVYTPSDFDFVDIPASSSSYNGFDVSTVINARIPVTQSGVFLTLVNNSTPKRREGYIWVDNQYAGSISVTWSGGYLVDSETQDHYTYIEQGGYAVFKYVINGTDNVYIYSEKRKSKEYYNLGGVETLLDTELYYNFEDSVSANTSYSFSASTTAISETESGNFIITNTDTNPITISFSYGGQPVNIIRGDGTGQVVMEGSSTYIFSYIAASGEFYVTYGEDYA